MAPGSTVIAPRGPWAAGDGFSWFDHDTDDLRPVLAVIDDAIESVSASPAPPTILVASSQGAAVALAAALRPPPRPHLTAVVAFAGFLPEPDALRLDRDAADDRPAVWLWSGEDDVVVPPMRVRSAARVLERHGLAVTVANGSGGHVVSENAVAAARDWLAGLL